MFEQSLIQLGLTYTQAAVYEVLLKNGTLPAGKIAKKTDFKRGLVYKILDDLMKAGLVQKEEEKGKVAIFEVKHPLELRDFTEKKQQKARDAKVALEGVLPAIISEFNLVHNQPGIRYYEGVEGVKKVLDHIANNFKVNAEIISFVKVLPAEFEKKVNESFTGFIKKRIKMNVRTRVLAVDTPEGKALKNSDKDSLRETRLTQIKNLPLNFPGGEIFIYESEICAVMMEKDVYFAFTVQSQSISQLLKVFFESEWEMLSPGNTTPVNSSLNSVEEVSFSKTA